MCGFDRGFPLVKLRTWAFIVGHTAPKAASSKVVKHEKTYSDNQHVFISLMLDAFDFLA